MSLNNGIRDNLNNPDLPYWIKNKRQHIETFGLVGSGLMIINQDGVYKLTDGRPDHMYPLRGITKRINEFHEVSYDTKNGVLRGLLNKKKEQGIEIHEQVEKWIKSGRREKPTNEKALSIVRQLDTLYRANNYELQAEFPVTDFNTYATSIDIIAFDKRTGEVDLLDIKTGKVRKSTAFTQLRAEKYMLGMSRPDLKVNNSLVITPFKSFGKQTLHPVVSLDSKREKEIIEEMLYKPGSVFKPRIINDSNTKQLTHNRGISPELARIIGNSRIKGYSLLREQNYGKPVTFLDIETGPNDQILSIAAIKARPNYKTGTFEVADKFVRYYQYLKGTEKLQPDLQEIHGLTPDVIRQKRRAHNANYSLHYNQKEQNDFINFVGDSVLAGQNLISYDLPHIYRTFGNNDIYGTINPYYRHSGPVLDTFVLAENHIPRDSGLRRNLGSLFQLFTGLTPEKAGYRAHDALEDTQITLEVAQEMWKNPRFRNTISTLLQAADLSIPLHTDASNEYLGGVELTSAASRNYVFVDSDGNLMEERPGEGAQIGYTHTLAKGAIMLDNQDAVNEFTQSEGVGQKELMTENAGSKSSYVDPIDIASVNNLMDAGMLEALNSFKTLLSSFSEHTLRLTNTMSQLSMMTLSRDASVLARTTDYTRIEKHAAELGYSGAALSEITNKAVAMQQIQQATKLNKLADSLVRKGQGDSDVYKALQQRIGQVFTPGANAYIKAEEIPMWEKRVDDLISTSSLSAAKDRLANKYMRSGYLSPDSIESALAGVRSVSDLGKIKDEFIFLEHRAKLRKKAEGLGFSDLVDESNQASTYSDLDVVESSLKGRIKELRDRDNLERKKEYSAIKGEFRGWSPSEETLEAFRTASTGRDLYRAKLMYNRDALNQQHAIRAASEGYPVFAERFQNAKTQAELYQAQMDFNKYKRDESFNNRKERFALRSALNGDELSANAYRLAQSEEELQRIRIQEVHTNKVIHQQYMEEMQKQRSLAGQLQQVKPYDFFRLADVAYTETGHVMDSAKGVIPEFIRRPASRFVTSLMQEQMAVKEKAQGVWGAVSKGILPIVGAGVGTALGGAPGALLGLSAGQALGAGATQVIGNLMEGGIKSKSYSLQARFNQWGAVLDASSTALSLLKIPVDFLIKAFKTLAGTVLGLGTALTIYMRSGLNQMNSLATPLTTMSGVDYRSYQGTSLIDTYAHLSAGATNASIENIAAMGYGLYTTGSYDSSKLTAAAMLGVFSDVYQNKPMSTERYYDLVNKLAGKVASSSNPGNVFAQIRTLDPTIAQTIQVMRDQGLTDVRSLQNGRGMYWNPLSNQESAQFRQMGYEYSVAQQQMDISKMRIASKLWESVGREAYDTASEVLDLVARGKYDQAIKLIKEKLAGLWSDVQQFLNDHNIDTSSAGATIRSLWEKVKDPAADLAAKALNAIKPLFMGFVSLTWDAFSAIAKAANSAFAGLIVNLSDIQFGFKDGRITVSRYSDEYFKKGGTIVDSSNELLLNMSSDKYKGALGSLGWQYSKGGGNYIPIDSRFNLDLSTALQSGKVYRIVNGKRQQIKYNPREGLSSEALQDVLRAMMTQIPAEELGDTLEGWGINTAILRRLATGNSTLESAYQQLAAGPVDEFINSIDAQKSSVMSGLSDTYDSTVQALINSMTGVIDRISKVEITGSGKASIDVSILREGKEIASLPVNMSLQPSFIGQNALGGTPS